MLIKGSITALVTPMNEKGDLDYDSLEKLINYQINSGISGLGAVGTTGESATIDFKDHIKLIEFFVKINKGQGQFFIPQQGVDDLQIEVDPLGLSLIRTTTIKKKNAKSSCLE